jgi:hypothetical protein
VTAGPTLTFVNASPSLDGNSMFFGFTGTAFTDVLAYYQAGAHNTSTSFVNDFQVYITGTVQDAEFDTYQFLHSSLDEYMWGSQCQTGGFWQIWNALAGTWNNTSVSCSLSTSTWHHIVWNVHRVPGDTSCSGRPCMYYDTLTIDGTAHTINTTYPDGVLPTSFSDQTGANFQLDTNSSGGTVSENIDEANFTAVSPTASWNQTIGGTNTDGTITWTNIGIPNGRSDAFVALIGGSLNAQAPAHTNKSVIFVF